MDPQQRALVDAVAEQLAPLENLLFITGAGISVDSGLPTYRGVGGLYDGNDTDEGVPIEVALSGAYFREHPERTWKYMRQIGDACREARPNAAHLRIAELERGRGRGRVVTLTQNVDGLHVAAGSSNVIAIHGDANSLRCTACAWTRRVHDYGELDVLFAGQPVPRCPDCGAIVRPDVVLFEEMLPVEALSRLNTELRRGFDAVISIGTSAVFPYIITPVIEARRLCKLTVEINPGHSEVSDIVDFHLQLGAAEAMDALAERLRG